MDPATIELISDDDMPAAAAAAAEPEPDHDRARKHATFQAKRFLITIFSDYLPDDWDSQSLRRIFEKNNVTYGCWGRERGGATEKEHWHIYMRFEHKRNSSSVCNYFKRFCGKNIWCCKPVGKEIQIRDYAWCQGEHTDKAPRNISFGEFQTENFQPDWTEHQGKRTDIEGIRDAIKEGKDEAWIADNYPGDFLRMHGGISKMKALLGPKSPNRRQVEVILLWGPSDTGKTHRIMNSFPELFMVEPGRSPFDSYNGETTIFFDEWIDAQYPITKMNKFLDVWRCPIDCRYNNKFAAWTRVVICANSPPTNYYGNEPPMLQEAFRRRIRGRCWEVTSRAPSLEEIMSLPPTPL